MNDKYFLDTNIFIYSFDSSNPKKQNTAHQLISNALSGDIGCISYQVIQEFLNVATQKFATPLMKRDCLTYITNILEPLIELLPSIELYKSALDIKEGWLYSFYDSLIIAAALRANCNILYTEDLQHEQKIREMVILNPFIPVP
jgi:predicted nucleic acid-binding protein